MSSEQETTDTTVSVELFVRSLAPTGAHERQQAILDRLDDLQQDGHIESTTCTVWGSRICPETAPRVTDGRQVLHDISRLRGWAAGREAVLTPFFEERVVRSMDGESYTVIVPPVVCLAVSRDDELWGVFPSQCDGRTLSVSDALDALSGSGPAELFADGTAVQPGAVSN